MQADELFSLTGRVALVTGASGSLGEHFARMLARHGARVGLAARRADRLAELAEAIASDGGQAVAAPMDVLDESSVASAFDTVEDAFGTVDLLVNNAGVIGRENVLETEFADWQRVLQTNLDAVFLVSREAGRRLRDAGQPGGIVNIASMLGFAVKRDRAAYTTSKAGVVQLTKSLALDLAEHGIRANAIAPGFVETDINRAFLNGEEGRHMLRQTPQKRAGLPHELDGPLLLLASDAGRYMTGTTILVDGGHTLCMP